MTDNVSPAQRLVEGFASVEAPVNMTISEWSTVATALSMIMVHHKTPEDVHKVLVKAVGLIGDASVAEGLHFALDLGMTGDDVPEAIALVQEKGLTR